MPILRNKATSHFTQIPNEALRDRALSWKARGLLGFMLSHSDGWSFTIDMLVENGPDGKSAVSTGLQELTDAGYFRRVHHRNSQGRLAEIEYEVDNVPHYEWLEDHESPGSDFPPTDNPHADNQHPENRVVIEDHSSSIEEVEDHKVEDHVALSQKSDIAEEIGPEGPAQIAPPSWRPSTDETQEPQKRFSKEEIEILTRKLLDQSTVGTNRRRLTVTADRRHLVARYLRLGFDEAELGDAIRGIRQDDWWVDKGKATFDNALKTPERVEQFRDAYRQTFEPAHPSRPRGLSSSKALNAVDDAADRIRHRSNGHGEVIELRALEEA